MYQAGINIDTGDDQDSQVTSTVGEVSTSGATHTDKHDDPDLVLGRIITQYGMLSREQIGSALSAWQSGAGDHDFAAFLISNNYLDSNTLRKLVQIRDMNLQQQQKTRVPVKLAHDAALAPKINGGNAIAPDKTAGVSESIIKTTTTLKAVAEPEVKSNKPELLRYGPGVTLRDLLQQTIELDASDLHIHSGACLRLRLGGDIRDAASEIMTPQQCESLINEVLNDSQRIRLKEKFQVDFAYDIPGVGRYRVNVYQQRRGLDAVFRTIKPTPPTLAGLGLPEELKRYTEFHQGLVLFTGPAGCGKSSTMAAMVHLINKHRSDHILTIEDPIEYLHPSLSCNVNQREAGVHSESFAKALRAALREDPDVIVIGELRDLETIELALTAAETGHLVLATLHTSGAIRTINRLLGVFPADQQGQVRMMLSEALKVVISQRLLQRADGRGQVAALEVMVNNHAIGNLIREDRSFQVKSIMQTGGAQGQQLLDTSLANLVKQRAITSEEAIRYADEPENFT